MAAKSSKAQARRVASNRIPSWLWLVIGMVLGFILFLMVSGLLKRENDGFIRFGPTPNPDARPVNTDQSGSDPVDIGISESFRSQEASSDTATETPRYEFYDVLTGRETRMSDAELAAIARAEDERRAQAALTQTDNLPTPLPESTSPAPTAANAAGSPPRSTPSAPSAPPVADNTHYLLQVDSYTVSTGDAESLKARIALLGLPAQIVPTTVNNETVYLLRMGPYHSTSELNDARKKLQDSGLSVSAIRAQ